MPFFNFRRGQASPAAAKSAAQSESVDVVRKRAKHRLIGAVVLVLAGVVGFPLLFDTQPRPVAVDISIEIPGKNTVKPLVMPAPTPATAPAATTAAASPPVASSTQVAAPSSLTPREEIITEKKAEAPVETAQAAIKNEAKPESKPEPKPEPKVVAKAPVSSEDGARAKALLEGKAVEVEGRLVVQVGAFADAGKASEVRQKLERAGLKTYTQVADTKDGKRIRVRVGPFSSKADADKAAGKIKGLDLPAAILTL
ncbi:SPOR domain-containing protein [Polaromonas sp. SM01]|uniref:SPOR domain-containing protein n=1 Tax=Polaromonas sp. SM01 TaxID=3085630 RepID=UPI0029822C67|nr:SPOR domain-containing protein [Polaromonas sp. SM01]MDW5442826.1 SPOR domain-containing protein [Polaromonas sp. SM01]